MYQTSNISESEYQSLKARYDNYHAQRANVCKHSNVVTQEEAALLPEPLTREQISQIEVFEFRNDPPLKYFAYVNCQGNYPSYITTRTGEILGEVVTFGAAYRSNMGDVRQNITIRAINGKRYTGTYYKSSGNYCRLRMVK